MNSLQIRLLVLSMMLARPLAAATITVTTTADTGPGSIRDALMFAGDGDVIDATGISGTIELWRIQELSVPRNVTILGPGPDNLAVDGVGATRVFHIEPGVVATISGLSITNGQAVGGGGIYCENASLTLTNCAVTGNHAEAGAGIFKSSQTSQAILRVVNCTVSGNGGSGQSLGGGIYDITRDSGTNMVIVNSSVNNNQAGTGGGIYIWSDYDMSNTTPSTVCIAGSTLSGNAAAFWGGAICFSDGGRLSGTGVVYVAGCTLSSNAAASGGAVFNGGMLDVSDSALVGNLAAFGGGIYNSVQVLDNGATVRVSDSSFIGNLSTNGQGGGIFNEDMLTIVSSTFTGNSAPVGGGLLNYHHGRAQVLNSTFSGNRADSLGAGIYTHGSMSVLNCTLSGNEAPAGAQLYIDGNYGAGTLDIGSTILNAGASGGTIASDWGTVNSLGFNLSTDDSGGLLNQLTDLVNTDPMLGPLQDNGGPTFTHALLCGSPAIDQGSDLGASVADQRGLSRPFDDPTVANAIGGDGTDIGAFEVQPGVCSVQDSDGDGVADDIDQCPNTKARAIVDATGCSIQQLVPCEGPLSGGSWKCHGQYVRAVIGAASDFLKGGFITRRQWAGIVTKAAYSKCGWNRHSDHEADPDWHRNWNWAQDCNWGRGLDWGHLAGHGHGRDGGRD